MLIQKKTNDEGEVLNKWLYSRLIRNNKNVLIGVTGPTGSGKSYACHRITELWYKYHFKEDYNVKKNTCFSIKELMDRLTDKEHPPRKGEIYIIEEAGTQLNSLDFQNKIQKVFSFVLQSFRSMNVGLLFNLPVLFMLNKSARYLLHAHFMTTGIDAKNKTSTIKPLFLQINQQKEKIYTKYLRVKVNGVNRPVKRFNFNLPSENILKDYEMKKFKFVSDLNENFVIELIEKQTKEDMKLRRKELSDVELEVYPLLKEGLSQVQIAEKLGVTQPAINQAKKRILNKGYKIKNMPILLEN